MSGVVICLPRPYPLTAVWSHVEKVAGELGDEVGLVEGIQRHKRIGTFAIAEIRMNGRR
jgi:hypothetical protein